MTLYLFSNPFLFHEFERAWEVNTSSRINQNDTFDVAVVLGGMVNFNNRVNHLDFQTNSDRILNILPLYFEGRIKKIMLSGGSGKLTQEEVEAFVLADYLISIGVNKKDLILESKSRNTYENARYSSELIAKEGFEKILLSTSAMHMKRSILCFQKQGVDVIPFSIDAAEKRSLYPDELFLPKAEILSDWYHLIHEWVGLLVYTIFGFS